MAGDSRLEILAGIFIFSAFLQVTLAGEFMLILCIKISVCLLFSRPMYLTELVAVI